MLKNKLDSYNIVHRIRKQNSNLIRFNSLWVIISALTIGLSLVAVIIITVIIYIYSNYAINQSIEQNNTHVVLNVSQSIDSYIKEMITISDTVSGFLKNGNIDELKQNSFIFLREDIQTIMIFDKDNHIVFTTKSGQLRKDIELTRSSWFKGVSIKNSEYMISKPHTQRLYENEYPWVITLTKSITWEEDGEVQHGLIVVDMNFLRIKDLCTRDVKNKGYLYIVNANGDIIYHPNQQMLYAGITPQNIIFTSDLSEGASSIKNKQGNLAIYVKSLENIEWRVVGVEAVNGLANYSSEPNQYIAISVVLLIITVLIGSLLISRAIVKPIYNLMDLMDHAWSKEKIRIAPTTGIYEVTKLGESFNKMVERIDELVKQVKLEQELIHKTEFKALTNQINPHFLYNTLEAVVWLAQSGEKQLVTQMIIALSKYFRLSLSGGKDFITIEEEMLQIENYLIIEKMRFGDAFTYEVVCDELIKYAKTPKIMLQPIVENAIVHGIGTMGEDGKITITAQKVDDTVQFIVYDNGCGIKKQDLENILRKQPKSKSGMGIRNVHQRVQLLYGPQYGVFIESELDEGTTVYIKLPLNSTAIEGEKRI